MADLWYEWEGPAHGPVVAVLHGALNRARSCFRRLVPVLTARGFRVLLYDRRGNGGSGPKAWGPRYHAEDAADLLALLRSLRVERCTLLGNSDGGTIALLAASIAPALVTSVVLCGGTHLWNGLVEPPVDAGKRRAKRVALARQMMGDPADLAKRVEDHGSEERARAVLDRWLDWWVSGPSGEVPTADEGWDLSGDVGGVRCPVLALHGRRDWDRSHGEEHLRAVAALLPHVEIHVLDASHAPQADCPETVAELTDNLLRRARL